MGYERAAVIERCFYGSYLTFLEIHSNESLGYILNKSGLVSVVNLGRDTLSPLRSQSRGPSENRKQDMSPIILCICVVGSFFRDPGITSCQSTLA